MRPNHVPLGEVRVLVSVIILPIRGCFKSFLAALLALTVSKQVGSVLLVLAALVGLCRVLSGIHAPLDVLAAIAISIISVTLALRFAVNPSVKSQPERG